MGDDKAKLDMAVAVEVADMDRGEVSIVPYTFDTTTGREVAQWVVPSLTGAYHAMADVESFIKMMSPMSVVSHISGVPGEVGAVYQAGSQSFSVSGGGEMQAHMRTTTTVNRFTVLALEPLKFVSLANSVTANNAGMRQITMTFGFAEYNGQCLVTATFDGQRISGAQQLAGAPGIPCCFAPCIGSIAAQIESATNLAIAQDLQKIQQYLSTYTPREPAAP